MQDEKKWKDVTRMKKNGETRCEMKKNRETRREIRKMGRRDARQKENEKTRPV